MILQENMNKKKLFLLDAYALIYRSYYAFIRNPRVNSKGNNTSAVFGFVNTLEEVLTKENPTHIAVAFDPPGPTFRHEEFEDYKAQREATPEDIKWSVPIIKKIIKAYNIPILEVEGYEADDVIGTVAKRANKERFDIYMMTPDKDYGQLVEPHIFIYKPRYRSNDFDILDDQRIKEKYGLTHPKQVIDLLGLMGDSSDNIPGCPGVGEKTALKLLKQFGSIDNLLKQTDQLKGALKKKVETHAEQIRLSRMLATIKTDVPIKVDEELLKRGEKDEEAIREIFEELEFRTLLNRIFKEDTPPPASNKPIQGSLFDFAQTTSHSQLVETEETTLPAGFTNIETSTHNYKMIESEKERVKLAKLLSQEKEFCFDTETTDVDPLSGELVGISFSFKEGEAYYVPVSDKSEQVIEEIAPFKPIFEEENIAKIGQNIKYDILQLRKYGTQVKGRLFDTMIAHYLLNPEQRHSMDYQAESYLKYRTISIEELIGPRGKNQINLRDLPPAKVKDYACEDADITLQLKNILEKEIKNNGLEKLFYEVELPLIYVLADMEWSGVRLDLDALKELSQKYTSELESVEQQIMLMAGVEFNINSPKQTGEILFDRLKISNNPKKTKTGQYKTSEDELEKLRNKHPIVESILEQRGLKKLLSTYIDAFPLLVNKQTKKVHTSFNQTVAATGRLSSTNPNLQNIPIRDERGREMRKVFIPDEGCLFVSSDYSQIELRIMAHLSGDEKMVEAFNKGQDIHAATASKIFKTPIEKVTSEMRRKAKTSNFGIIYGISPFGLSERLNIPRREAKN